MTAHFFRFVAFATVAAAMAPQLSAQETIQCNMYVDSLSRIARPVIDDTITPGPLFWRVSLCVGRGPGEIARLWSLPDLTDREYMQLSGSSRIADVRLADTLIAIARRSSVRAFGRVAALFALGHQISSSTPMTVGGLLMIGRSDTNYYSPHGGGTPGGRPLTDVDRQRVIRAFSDLSIQTAAPTVQQAARGALRVSAETSPRLTTLPSGTVTLTYMCGNRFRFRNRSAVWGAFAYDVYGTSERGSLDVRVSQSPTVASEAFFVTRNRGTVRVFWQKQLLQTKANGGTTCP